MDSSVHPSTRPPGQRRLPSIGESGPPRAREFILGLLAGALGGLLLGLAILKLTAGDALWAHPLRTQYLTALIGESAAGFHLLVKPRALVSWLLACGLCGLLFIYAWLGPPLRDCLCLGFLAELGPRGRSSLAGGLLAVSLAGVAVLRWNPGIRTS